MSKHKHTPGRQSSPLSPRRTSLDERRLIAFYLHNLADVVTRVTTGKRWRFRGDVTKATRKQLSFIEALWAGRDDLGFVPEPHQDSLERCYRAHGGFSKAEAAAFITIFKGLHEYKAWPVSSARLRPIRESLAAQEASS